MQKKARLRGVIIGGLGLIVLASIAWSTTAKGGGVNGIRAERMANYSADLFAYETTEGISNGAVFGTLDVVRAGKDNASVLVGVETDICRTSEIHTMVDDNGIMRMRPVGQLAFDEGGHITFAASGYHVMLIGLHHPLKGGDSFAVQFTFDNGDTQRIIVPVRKREKTVR